MPQLKISWSVITASVTTSLGSYNWQIPNTPSTTVKVKISDVLDATKYVESGVFKISNITVTSPTSANNWQAGQTKQITWSAQSVDNVKIEYSTNSGTSWLTIIATMPASSGTYSWLIPSTASKMCIVKVSDVAFAEVKDTSNIFTISSFAINNPQVSNSWQVGQTKQITWNISNIDNVKLEIHKA